MAKIYRIVTSFWLRSNWPGPCPGGGTETVAFHTHVKGLLTVVRLILAFPNFDHVSEQNGI